MLTAADLEVNVLEFRQRAFQFDRLGTVGDEVCAVFRRTETESESQFRPRIVHLAVVVPLAWVVLDEAADLLRVAKDGRALPMAPTAPVLGVRAERTDFKEDGVEWHRAPSPGGTLVYAPTSIADRVLGADGRAALGLT